MNGPNMGKIVDLFLCSWLQIIKYLFIFVKKMTEIFDK
jgi:hypothetical protein